MEQKIYKIKHPWGYWLSNVLFCISISFYLLAQKNNFSVAISIVLIIEAVLYLWYAFSHKFILDYASREIREDALGGLVNKKIKVDDIKEYYIFSGQENPDYIGAQSKNKIATRVNLLLNKEGNEVLADKQWMISFEEAGDLFFEAKKINPNITCANTPFYQSSLNKRYSTILVIAICLVIVVIFFIVFFNMLNSGLNPHS